MLVKTTLKVVHSPLQHQGQHMPHLFSTLLLTLSHTHTLWYLRVERWTSGAPRSMELYLALCSRRQKRQSRIEQRRIAPFQKSRRPVVIGGLR